MTSDKRFSPLSLATNDNFISHPFPSKMHDMLQYAEASGLEDVISWQPDGTAFKVHNPDALVNIILPKFFRQTKFKSFQRQLHLYNFERIWEGPNRGGYRHQLFVKGRREISRHIVRQSRFENKRIDRLASLLDSLGSNAQEVYQSPSNQLTFRHSSSANNYSAFLCRPKGFTASGLNLERIQAATALSSVSDYDNTAITNIEKPHLQSLLGTSSCGNTTQRLASMEERDSFAPAASAGAESDDDSCSLSTFDVEIGLVFDDFNEEDLWPTAEERRPGLNYQTDS